MLDQLITDVPLVFVDTETTGLSPGSGDRVVEIALARFRGDQKGELVMEDHYVTLVNPGRSIPPSVSRIHGITDLDVRNEPRFADIIPQLRLAFSGAVLVMHNAPFDLGFISNEFYRARETPPDNLVLDTLALLRRNFSFPSNSLPRVAEMLGIKRLSHRALADVLTTYEVFDSIIKELWKRGARTLADILQLQAGPVAWPDRPVEDLEIPEALEEALRLGCKLYLRYRDEFGEQTERFVSPIQVFPRRNYIYLRAHCHLRNGERSFRLDRVVEMRIED